MVTKQHKLTDIADIERANESVEYPAGTVYMQVSATKGQTGITQKRQSLGSKYVIIKPKKYIYPPYFLIAIERAVPKFLARNQTTINLQVDSFVFFEIDIHENIEDQIKIAGLIAQADLAIKKRGELIDKLKTIKKIALSKMLV